MRGRDRELRLSTVFDDLVVAKPLPAVFARGDDPAFQLIDGFARGIRILGRFTTTPGLVGLRVVAGERPVRVTVALRVDHVSDEWWTERVAPPAGGSEDPGAPRLVQVRSQGVAQGAIALSRAPWAQPGAPVRGVLSFELEPQALPADGLLFVELADAPGLHGEQAAQVLLNAGVGVQPTEISVEEVAADGSASGQTAPEDIDNPVDAVTAERRGWLRTGDLPPATGSGSRTVRGGVAVVDLPAVPPGYCGVTLALSPRNPPPQEGGGSGPDRPVHPDARNDPGALRAAAASMIDGSDVGVRLVTAGSGVQLSLTGDAPGPVRLHLFHQPGPGWNLVTVTRHGGLS